MNASGKLEPHVIYQKTEIDKPDFKGTKEEVTVAAVSEGNVVGFMQLEVPKNSMFNQGGKEEFELICLFFKKDIKNELVSFLLKNALDFINAENRVLVIENGLFAKSYLMKKGFEEHSLNEQDILVYGKEYHYNLKNIDPDCFAQLNQDHLNSDDTAYIEAVLGKADEEEEENNEEDAFAQSIYEILKEVQSNSEIPELTEDFLDENDLSEEEIEFILEKSEEDETQAFLKTLRALMNHSGESHRRF